MQCNLGILLYPFSKELPRKFRYSTRPRYGGSPRLDQFSVPIFTVIYGISYTLSREYRVARSRYSRLLFTSEDRISANLRVQEQSTNMTSQCR